MPKQFRVGARAASNMLIREGETISVNFILDGNPIQLAFRTRYLNLGFSSNVPGDLWLDAQGSEETLDLAAARFTNAGRTIGEIISIATNAAIAPIEAEVIFETTPGKSSRQYLQRFVAAEKPALTSRFVNISATVELIEKIATHTERARLLLGITHYCEALRTWRMGNEVPAISHLFVGAEAMKVVCLRQELQRTNLTRDQLAHHWGFDINRSMTKDQYLELNAQIRLVFNNDYEVYKTVKKISDAVEHGLETFGSLYQPAGRNLVLTAKYLRESIMRTSSISDAHFNILMGQKFDKPRGQSGHDHYMRATMNGDKEESAAPGEAYPYCEWVHNIQEFAFDAVQDKYVFKPKHTFTARIADGFSFGDIRLETWDGAVFSPDKSWQGSK